MSPMTTTEERLAQIEARAKAARSLVLMCDDYTVKAREHKTSLYRWHFDGSWHDANQLSNAPDDIKHLLDLVRRQAEALAAVEGLTRHEGTMDDGPEVVEHWRVNRAIREAMEGEGDE